MNLAEVVKAPEYDFLRTNPNIVNKVMFLTLGGSRAYGTNLEDSDTDIRGCVLNSKSDLIGLTHFETFVDTNTDTTIYSFTKLVSLLLNCNPNTIEMLGGKKEHYCMVTPLGQLLIDNVGLFLTKRAVNSFGEYATNQLRRLQNNLARHNVPLAEKQKHILNSCNSAMRSFNERFAEFPQGSFKLYVGESDREDMETDLLMDVTLKGYPLMDYTGAWNELKLIAKNYNALNHRNKKKDDNHLNKHAMHLVRLYHMCFDILEKGIVKTYREEDHDMLMNIRNGGCQDAEGNFFDSFYEMIRGYEERLKYAAANSSLPEEPDMKKVQDFVMSVNERVIHSPY